MPKCELVQASKWHDWEFATHRSSIRCAAVTRPAPNEAADKSYELTAHISEVANHTYLDYTEVKRQPGQELNAVSSARERVNWVERRVC